MVYVGFACFGGGLVPGSLELLQPEFRFSRLVGDLPGGFFDYMEARCLPRS